MRHDHEALAFPRRLVAALVALLSGAAAQAQCDPDWSPAQPPLGVGGDVYAMVNWDPDGPGPSPSRLIVGGEFTTAAGSPALHVAAWYGGAWHSLGSGLNDAVHALASWDPDGDGLQPPQLIAAGKFISAGPTPAAHAARWDEPTQSWLPLGSGLNDGVLALTVWDDDGPGLNPSQLVAVGQFTSADGSPANRVARWDGSAWHAMGAGLGFIVRAATAWDRDGTGPQPAQLVVGGDPVVAGATSLLYGWDGTAWLALGPALNGAISALTSWDPDGDGPLPADIIAGGNFRTAGALTVNRVARWDPAAGWQVLRTGFDSTVYALTSWDPDGPAGPQPLRLIAAGNFTHTGTLPINYVAYWNAFDWDSLGSGSALNERARALAVWDPDGPGPSFAQIFASGLFTTGNGIARWNGTQWVALGSGFGSGAWAMTSWDPDGSGPANAVLLVGNGSVGRWDGVSWQTLGSGGASGGGLTIHALTAWNPDPAASERGELVVGGLFDKFAGDPAAYWSRWIQEPSPLIAAHPQDQTINSGGTVLLETAAVVSYGPFTYQWRRDGDPVSDGPGGASTGGGTVAGAATASLTIADARLSDAGGYDCVVSNDCGSTISTIASLTVLCPVDLTGDGLVDFSDYLEFLNLFDAMDPRVDFNTDGLVDFSDYLEFLNLFDAGC